MSGFHWPSVDHCLAAGEMGEEEYARWLERSCEPRG